MGRAGRARVLSDFTLEANLDAMERLYAEVTRPSRSTEPAMASGNEC